MERINFADIGKPSSQIVGFEAISTTKHALAVKVFFHSNPEKPYFYRNVPPQVVVDWIFSESPGKFYNRNIRKNPKFLWNVNRDEVEDIT